ncbi:transcription factor Ouib [Drosophila eugracilis]|uniref:transcription factor Ouib n=1 Tax=Drosophila eugracilis TaxID=29029 RepID=UPI0007E5D6F9|nr:transcription factor Ouib [Drosophila eugracilis]
MASRHCRTCGKFIFSLTPKNLFREPDSVTLHQIEALTGLFLLEGPEDQLPSFMCAPCEMFLKEAISFRERIILTQKTLQNNSSNSQVLDLNEPCEVLQPDEPQFFEEIKVLDVLLVDPPLEEEELPKEIEHVKDQSEEKSSVQKVPRQNSHKSTPSVSTSVKFADNSQDTNRFKPRTQWDRLSEDEVVALKRERRRRECICEQCGRHFSCPSNFKLHLLRHTGVKSFACDQCPQRFYTATLLRRHQDLHSGVSPYQCRYCEASFNNPSVRIQHERIRHTNDKPFKCKECGKSFTMSGKLSTHMLSHTGVRAFHCASCKVSFVRRSHLVAHYRSKGHVHAASSQESEENALELDVETVMEGGT